MSWGLVASAAITVVGGVVSSQGKNKQVRAQNANALQQEALAWENNESDNKAIKEANLQNMIRTGYRAGILNIQRGQAKKAAAEVGLTLGKNRLALAGTANANSFAAGQVGSSVDAVSMDIQQKVDEAQQDVDESYLLTEANFDIQMHDLLTQGMDAQRSSRKAAIQEAQLGQQTGIGESLMQSAVQIGGNYLSANMSLGLGSTNSSLVKPGIKTSATSGITNINNTGVF